MENKETKTKYLESRLAANRRYYEKNKKKIQLSNNYSRAKLFIKDTDNIEKLNELIELVTNKIKEVKERGCPQIE